MNTPTAVDQLTIAAVASFLLQRLKASPKFPFLNEQSHKIVKIVFAAIAAAASVLGLTYSYDPATHVLTVANLSLTTMGHAAWAFLKQYMLQHGWYSLQGAAQNGAPAAPKAA